MEVIQGARSLDDGSYIRSFHVMFYFRVHVILHYLFNVGTWFGPYTCLHQGSELPLSS